METNDSLYLSDELSDYNLKQLGFTRSEDTGDFHCICQYKNFTLITKTVTVVVSSDMERVYALIETEDISPPTDASQTTKVKRKEHQTIQLNVMTLTELIVALRVLKEPIKQTSKSI